MTNRNELERLLAAATEGPWRGYSEPDVGLPYSLFAGEVMRTGFAPLEPLTAVDIDLICFLRNNAHHYLSLMDEVEKLRRDRETLIEFAKSINSWRSDCDSYDRECSNPHRNYCEDVELMELSAGHALRRVNASQALGETHDR